MSPLMVFCIVQAIIFSLLILLNALVHYPKITFAILFFASGIYFGLPVFTNLLLLIFLFH